jgi:DNA polymerase-3 subunit gamma/tau
VIFVFATTEPAKVPDTVASRTQRFDFKPLNDEEIGGRLEVISSAEGIQAEEEAIKTIAHYSDGSMRDGIALLEQLSSYAPEQITLEAVSELLGLISRDFYLNLFQLIRDGKAREALETADATFREGYSAVEFVRGFQEASEDLLRTRIGLSSGVFKEFSETVRREDVLAFVRTGLDMERAIRYSVRPRVWVDYHLVRLSALESVVNLDEVLRIAGVSAVSEYAGDRPGKVEAKTREEEETGDQRVVREMAKEEPEDEETGEEPDAEPEPAEDATEESHAEEEPKVQPTPEEQATSDVPAESEDETGTHTDGKNAQDAEAAKKRLMELFDLEVIKDV